MGSIRITVPDSADHQLVFNDAETKEILGFFWPHLATSVNGMAHVSTAGRRLAQTALIAALEGSYAMGFIDLTFRALGAPKASVVKWARTLAQKLAGYTWRHLKFKDLKDARVYHRVRDAVALKLKTPAEEVVAGAVVHERRGWFKYYASMPHPRGVA